MSLPTSALACLRHRPPPRKGGRGAVSGKAGRGGVGFSWFLGSDIVWGYMWQGFAVGVFLVFSIFFIS